MDFGLTEAQRDLAALTRSIVTTPFEEPGQPFDQPLWTALGKAGVLAAALPVEAGGDGYGPLERCAVLVELGRAVAAVPYLASIATAAMTVARFGNPAQLARWAAPAARGELVLTAALADDAGAGAFAGAGAVRARREPDGWTLTGSRTTVPALPGADAILVPAQVDGTDAGTAVFIVTPTDAGVSTQPQWVAGDVAEGWLELADCAVADDRLLGTVAQGTTIAAWALAQATVGLCAAQLGVTERALELTAEYARTRVQFGRPIGGFQAVAQRLADAYIDVEAIRLTLWQAAWLLSRDLPCAAEVATAKFWAAEAGHRVAHTAVHVHGGVGIDVEYPLHRYFLAAKHHEFALGGATHQLRQLGTLLAAST